jgi:hypothetical protein
LSESRFDTRLFETRVFVVILVFSIIAGLNTAFAPYIYYWFRQTGYSAVEYGAFNILETGFWYLLNSVLFFIVLYVTCGGPLLNRIARVLTSLVLGSVIGHWIGGSIGAIVSMIQLGEVASYAWIYPLYSLPTYAVGQVLIGFAVLALSDMNVRWRGALAIQEQSTRPGGVVVLAVLYAIFALLDVLAIPLLAAYPAYSGTSYAAFAIMAVFFGLVVSGQLVLAFGLYYGKKWGWILAVISSASSSLINISTLSALLINGAFINTQLLTFSLSVGLLVSLAVLLYLLSLRVRQFFGFVNPIEPFQDISTEGKSQ